MIMITHHEEKYCILYLLSLMLEWAANPSMVSTMTSLQIDIAAMMNPSQHDFIWKVSDFFRCMYQWIMMKHKREERYALLKFRHKI